MIADDAGPVPLVFLLHRTNRIPRVAIVVIVTAEEAALPARSLAEGRAVSRMTTPINARVCVRLLSAHHLDAFAATQPFIVLPFWQVGVTWTPALPPLTPFSLPSLLRLLLFLQLVLKVLQVPIGALVGGV